MSPMPKLFMGEYRLFRLSAYQEAKIQTIHIDFITFICREYFEYFPPLQVFAHNNSMGEPIAGNFCRIRELAMKR